MGTACLTRPGLRPLHWEAVMIELTAVVAWRGSWCGRCQMPLPVSRGVGVLTGTGSKRLAEGILQLKEVSKTLEH